MKLKEIILDWLYPSRCAFCHRFTDAGVLLCRHCKEKLPYTEGLAAEQHFANVARCVSPLYYADDVRESILRYKFHGATGYCKVYGELLAKCIDENGFFCDIISWVPLSRKRLMSRGYNQSELIGRELSMLTGIPCIPTLEKRVNNSAQSGISNADKRRANVKGVYSAVFSGVLKGKTVLLIDDVVTTGATLSECASVLKKAGAAQVCAATVARRRE